MHLQIPLHLVEQIKAVLNEFPAAKVHALLNAIDNPAICNIVNKVAADAALLAPIAAAIPAAAPVAAIANEVAQLAAVAAPVAEVAQA